MVEFNSDSDGVENLSNPSSYDGIPYHDSYYGTMTEGFGSGIRVRRDGWYRGWGKVCVGRRFKHRDNLTLIISKYNKNQDKLRYMSNTWSNNSFLSVQEIQDPNETTSMVSDDDRPEG